MGAECAQIVAALGMAAGGKPFACAHKSRRGKPNRANPFMMNLPDLE
jgi:hypothetical protein